MDVLIAAERKLIVQIELALGHIPTAGQGSNVFRKRVGGGGLHSAVFVHIADRFCCGQEGCRYGHVRRRHDELIVRNRNIVKIGVVLHKQTVLHQDIALVRGNCQGDGLAR